MNDSPYLPGNPTAKRVRSQPRRTLSRLADYEWGFVGLAALVALGLGGVGFFSYFKVIGEPRSVLDVFYLSLQLFTLESGSLVGSLPIELEVARLLAPTVLGYTAVKALLLIFRDQIQAHRIRFLKGHVVICGLGRKGTALAREFSQAGYRVVGIDADVLNGEIEQCKGYGAIVLPGDATDPRLLARAGVRRSRYVFAVCGNDGANAEVGVNVREMVEARQRTVLTCFVHVSDLELIRLLREREITTQESDAFRLEFFNVYDSGTQALVISHPPFDAKPNRHVLVVGTTPTANALIVRIAKLWHALDGGGSSRFELTVVDRLAEDRMIALCSRHPPLNRICDIETWNIDTASVDFVEGALLDGSAKRHPVTAVYVCLDSDAKGIAAALALRQRLAERQVPIVVATRHESGLTELLRGEDGNSERFGNLRGFGLIDRACGTQLLISGTHEVLARATHESYVREQRDRGATQETNPSMVPWEKLPESLKDSNRRQADHIGVKLKAIDCRIAPLDDWLAQLLSFTDEEVEQLARMEHARWMAERINQGWRYGPDKDVQKKTSPFLIPWEDPKLLEETKDLDRLVARELPAFLARAGFVILRTAPPAIQ